MGRHRRPDVRDQRLSESDPITDQIPVTATVQGQQSWPAVSQPVPEHAYAQEQSWDAQPGPQPAATELPAALVLIDRPLSKPDYLGGSRHRAHHPAGRGAIRLSLTFAILTIVLVGSMVALVNTVAQQRLQVAGPPAALLVPAPSRMPAPAAGPEVVDLGTYKVVVPNTQGLLEPDPVSTTPRVVRMALPAKTQSCKIQNEFGDVQSNVRQVACFLGPNFGVAVLGRAKRGTAGSEHPSGLAADFLVGTQRKTGQAIADCASRHFNDWGIKYIIWRQAIKVSAGARFRGMEDRGDATANHFDHVHISFNRGGPPKNLTC